MYINTNTNASDTNIQNPGKPTNLTRRPTELDIETVNNMQRQAIYENTIKFTSKINEDNKFIKVGSHYSFVNRIISYKNKYLFSGSIDSSIKIWCMAVNNNIKVNGNKEEIESVV